jgi:2-iminobutanoate/2-iminopropanoate deaminase
MHAVRHATAIQVNVIVYVTSVVTKMQYFDLSEERNKQFPYSQAVRCGDLIFVAGQLAADDPAFIPSTGDIESETRTALDRIGRILSLAGSAFEDVVRVGIFMTDLDEFDAMNATYRTYFTGSHLPARTCVGVSRLLAGGKIEIDCVARIRPK